MEKTIEIPEGYEARIDGNKVIIEPKESEDEKIRKALIRGIESVCKEEEVFTGGFTRKQIVSWLEKQGSQNLANSAKTCKNEHNPAWSKEDKERYISCLQRLSTGNSAQPETINTKWFKERIYPLIFGNLSGEQNSTRSEEN